MSKKNLILLSLILLVGCSTTKGNKDIVTETKTVYIEIPAALLKPCSLTEPYDKVEFIQKNSQVKEGILTDLVIHLYSDLRNCNTQIQSIQDFQNQTLKKAGK